MQILQLEKLILKALEEDIGCQDITTDNLIAPDVKGTGAFMAKSFGVIAGLEICRQVFICLDPQIEFTFLKHDGDQVESGDILAVVKGPYRVLLTGERTALNFLQRLSGIATRTRKMVDLIKHEKAIIVDTRKTTPGLRVLEKYAVVMGGARNHRFGLFDGAMIKDNHIKAVGSITKAVARLREKLPHTIKIEVETENLEQVKEALASGADIIMLDNMELEMMETAVKEIAGRALTEASGGITEKNLQKVAMCGVDFISIGALTHSVSSVDISFNLVQNN
ncbi:MAG: carboxylating nicotinate-nucleotide diphosphorylase [Syntrophomonadaceae bacterium]|jgi:nicotinate-nucleotide pyrophosphorylase (carboxylating)|nr:carboxylating nicotinate-nucleotide diphosphorylase [Syntrophomonadaceae bacterium]